MSNRLATRVGRIISGSMHALIDALEGSTPEIVMEQAIREIDLAVDEVRLELGKAAAAKHLASRRLSQKNTEHEELSSRSQEALLASREDLAKAAVGRQLDIEAQMPILEETISDCAEEEKELEGYIAALQAKKREMEEELLAFRQEKQKANGNTSTSQAKGTSNVEKKVADASSAFERVLARYTNQRIKDTGSSSSKDLAELEQLARNNRIVERLAMIKSGDQDV